MKPVTVYSQSWCPYCAAALALLNNKGVEYDVITLGNDQGIRDEMLARSNGARTVPQIFIGDHHVGGFDDLNALERQGKLDALLAGQ